MKTKSFFLLLVLFVVSATQLSAQKIQLESPEARKLLKSNPSMVVLDVRTAEEFGAGHLKGAKNIDIRQDDFYSKVDKLDRNATYLVYCRTNHRSGAATDYMVQKGFKHVYQMMDGFPGWAANNFVYEK
ncbi:MAG TPA: rhodanese-like domain-containing protein [Paludibacter sp.]|nr:rhodanese-like domain-containing protein [Paludibacter sp.]